MQKSARECGNTTSPRCITFAQCIDSSSSHATSTNTPRLMSMLGAAESICSKQDILCSISNHLSRCSIHHVCQDQVSTVAGTDVTVACYSQPPPMLQPNQAAAPARRGHVSQDAKCLGQQVQISRRGTQQQTTRTRMSGSRCLQCPHYAAHCV